LKKTKEALRYQIEALQVSFENFTLKKQNKTKHTISRDLKLGFWEDWIRVFWV